MPILISIAAIARMLEIMVVAPMARRLPVQIKRRRCDVGREHL